LGWLAQLAEHIGWGDSLTVKNTKGKVEQIVFDILPVRQRQNMLLNQKYNISRFIKSRSKDRFWLPCYGIYTVIG
jgi:hypothetical protein